MPGEDSTSGDLHLSPGIRFVLAEIGKLTATVGGLVADVKDLKHQVDGIENRVQGIQHQVSFVKGALWASGAFLTVLVGAVFFFLSSKWNALEAAVRAALPH